MPVIETSRLILRPWRESDSEQLYEYAKDPRIGPMAGWLPHTSVENSREIIRDILSAEGTFAVTLKGADAAIGSVGVFPVRELPEHEGEPEIGYWIAAPFWGQGLIPEAVNKLLSISFTETDAKRVWCAHFEGNDKSRRVIEKCGFEFAFKREADVAQMNEKRIEYMYSISREDWLK